MPPNSNAALTPDQLAQLKSQLRDIHLPDAAHWWPPAPGWWLLGLLFTLACVAGFFILKPHIQRWRFRRMLLRKLTIIRNAYAWDKSAEQAVQGCAELLRRICLTHFPRQSVAGLTGQAWLDFLNQQTPKPCFSKKSILLLKELRFSHQNINANMVKLLLRDTTRWIKHFNPPTRVTGAYATAATSNQTVNARLGAKPGTHSSSKGGAQHDKPVNKRAGAQTA